jgi:hypothetical protein
MNEEDLKPAEGDDAEAEVVEEGDKPEDTGADSPYAELAQRIGWLPKDQFTGPPEQWKPADQFIVDGREIQRETASRLKTVESQLSNISKTSASIVEQQVKDRVAELTDRYNKAVEDGKPQEAFDLAKEITTINAVPTTGAPQPSAEAQAFVERNSAWFQKPGFEYETARAVEICKMLAGQGYTDHGTQLRIAEQRLRQENPKLFKDGMNGQRKDPPGVNAPGSRGAPPSNRQKGFADMPKEAQDIARDMVERKVIKSQDDYVRNYFANLAGKA